MFVRKCILFLFFIWLIFLAAGWRFFRFTQKRCPDPFPKSDIRHRFVKPWRFTVYVLLLPVALTCAVAIFLVWAADAGIIPNF